VKFIFISPDDLFILYLKSPHLFQVTICRF